MSQNLCRKIGFYKEEFKGDKISYEQKYHIHEDNITCLTKLKCGRLTSSSLDVNQGQNNQMANNIDLDNNLSKEIYIIKDGNIQNKIMVLNMCKMELDKNNMNPKNIVAKIKNQFGGEYFLLIANIDETNYEFKFSRCDYNDVTIFLYKYYKIYIASINYKKANIEINKPFEIKSEISISNYLKSGIRINGFISFDFSYNFQNYKNNYMEIFTNIRNYISLYNTKGKAQLYLYGYGARLKNSKNMDILYKNIFSINSRQKDIPIQYEKQIDEYIKVLGNIISNKKVYFSSLIRKILKIINELHQLKIYNVLFIIAQKINSEEDNKDTIDELIESSYLPISIIFIYEGGNEHNKMKNLFENQINVSSKRIQVIRNNIVLISYKDYDKDAKRMMESCRREIHKHIIEYYSLNKCTPEEIRVNNMKNIENCINQYKSRITQAEEPKEENDGIYTFRNDGISNFSQFQEDSKIRNINKNITKIDNNTDKNIESIINKIKIINNEDINKINDNNNINNNDDINNNKINNNDINNNDKVNNIIKDEIKKSNNCNNGKNNINIKNLNDNINKNGYSISRNKKSKLNYQSSDELMKISMKKVKSQQKQIYTNEHFKSSLPEFAKHLPKSIYHVYQYNNANIPKKCIICLDNFSIGEEILTLPCFHFFHCKCISDWLNKKKICPVCKNNI